MLHRRVFTAAQDIGSCRSDTWFDNISLFTARRLKNELSKNTLASET